MTVPIPDPFTVPDETFNVTAVPIPDHLASGDADEPPPIPQPASAGAPKRKRILGGTRDNGTRADRKIHKEPKPLPRIPNNGFAPGIEKMYLTIAMGVMPLDMELGVAIANIAEDAAKAWDELARRNDTVRRIIVAMMETTAVGAVFAAHMPIMLLVMGRVMKGDPRVSMIGDMLAREAEAHANKDTDGPTPQ